VKPAGDIPRSPPTAAAEPVLVAVAAEATPATSLPDTATAPSAPSAAKRHSKTPPKPTATAGTTVLDQRIRPALPADTPAKSPKKSRKLLWTILLLVVLYLIFGRDKTGSDHTSKVPAPAPEIPAAAPAAEPAAPDLAPAAAPTAELAEPAPQTVTEVLSTIPVDAAQSALGAMLAAARQPDLAPLLQARKGFLQLQLPAQGDSVAARTANKEGVEALQAQTYGEAVEHFKKALRADPRDQEAVTNLSYALYKQGNFADAQRAAMAALVLGPEQPVAWGNLAQAMAENGETDNAVSAFLLAVRVSPDQAKARDALRSMAQAGPSLAVRDAAGKAVGMMIDAVPADQDARTPAARVLAASPAPPPTPAPAFAQATRDNSVINSLMDDADTCSNARKYDCAISNAKAVLRLDPQHARARALLRHAETEQKRALDSITVE
jgi:tetratricopeptide (TPR) repeat protein